MSTISEHSAPDTSTFESFTRLPEREPSEQQHGYPFKPHRMPEAPLESDRDDKHDEELDGPARHPNEGDDELLSEEIDGIIYDIPS
ncbi:MAG: hypothetical protein IBX53_09540 [Halomonas sp.]|uniref:hypothetical protein n=1 Tax=Halomonas sp. TaxID=1486246 RepID=UPI001A0FFA36|nr:hypothetical protein [Halomonas sp.]MBE0489313.1 hypothetical protein [Halomonas sp.]